MFFNVASRVRDVFTVVLQLYIRIYVCIVFVCGGVNVLYAHIIVCLLFIDPMGTQKTNFSLSCWWLIIVFSLFFFLYYFLELYDRYNSTINAYCDGLASLAS